MDSLSRDTTALVTSERHRNRDFSVEDVLPPTAFNAATGHVYARSIRFFVPYRRIN